ncbi:MAG TPA: FAD-dependent oxidoreductase, partial [Kiloniellaceae bacterium]|nr:FAD-dependent oxidoreductase [Kiloniellaceae bacterium]
MTQELKLAGGLAFEDLYSRAGIARIDGMFLQLLSDQDAPLHARLLDAREGGNGLSRKDRSDLMLDLAPHLEDFLGELFGVTAELRSLSEKHDALAPLYSVKRLFVQRQAAKKVKPADAEGLDGATLEADLEARFGEPVTELSFARHIGAWEADREANADALEVALDYAAWATHSTAGQARWQDAILFRVPHKVDPVSLVPVVPDEQGAFTLPDCRLRQRDGFNLTDAGMDLHQALDQANYCIWCHNQGKDSCAKGLHDRKSGALQVNSFGVTLTGCPLDEKISEMNLAKTRGLSLAALAIATVDNPLCAATGHRICNDCMKACIYQRQDPVDIPQIETRSLKDVLELPWGFEIYSLLTRWVPLDFDRPLPRAESGYKVLVVGLGPAGFNLAHHLLNDGHSVVAIDGLKIEPLDPALSGRKPDGSAVPFRPIRDLAEIREPLGKRVLAGFGGVAEYGITVRWDKTFLKIVRLLLERRAAFAMYGGVRFGGTITVASALEMGFDHIALCAGAGRPRFVPMENGLAKGVRMASDFLMALQLTGAAKTDSLANLQLRLPVVVVGGGLTAIDAATEAQAYYPVQVEKFLARFEALSSDAARERFLGGLTQEEHETAEEFFTHARALRAERAAAAAEGREPRLRELVRS